MFITNYCRVFFSVLGIDLRTLTHSKHWRPQLHPQPGTLNTLDPWSIVHWQSPQEQKANCTAFTADPSSLFLDSWVVALCDFSTANNAQWAPLGTSLWAWIRTPLSSRTLRFLFCWVFPLSAERSTPPLHSTGPFPWWERSPWIQWIQWYRDPTATYVSL